MNEQSHRHPIIKLMTNKQILSLGVFFSGHCSSAASSAAAITELCFSQALLPADTIMDFDFRSFGLHPAKHFSSVQASCFHSDNSSVFYESDGDDDSRSYFPCPFCYVEIEVPDFCSHLQEEHCFDLKNAVCPLCAANLGKDATAHFIAQHSSSLKRRGMSEKLINLPSISAMFGKKLVVNARGNRHDPTTDMLLYPFVCNTSVQNSDSVHQDKPSSNNVSTISEGNMAVDEKDQQEKKEKASFVQQLMASTIFGD